MDYKESILLYDKCESLGYTLDDCRILNYIHQTIRIHDDDKYFEHPNEIDEPTLRYMISDKRFLRIDAEIREQYGMERRLISELNNRLRLYTDKKYRIKMLHIYEKEILPLCN